MFSTTNPTPSANHFILHLMHLYPNQTLGVQEVITACGVMGISANNARVALARLRRSGLVVPVGRGCYALAPKVLDHIVNPAAFGMLGFDNTVSIAALAMVAHNAYLNKIAQQLIESFWVWNGDYLMVYVSPSVANKHWLWAVGFRPLEPCLFVRPNTLAWTLAGFQSQAKGEVMGVLGRVFMVSALDAETTKSIRDLYPIKRMEQGYRHCIKALEKGDVFLAGVLQQREQMPSDKALRDCYALLERCDVLVQEDPYLPAEWLDPALLQQCLALRCALYQKAQQLWARRLQAWA